MNRFLIIIIGILSAIFMFIGCDGMNDIQQEYVEKGKRTYLGKVDSIEVTPGLNRVKLTWYIPADPRIENTIIYWNMKSDSIVKPFVRNTSGVQKDSVFVENLAEDTYIFEFRNTNTAGESSLLSSAQGNVWGEEFKETLRERKITARSYDPPLFKFKLTTVSSGDEIVYSKIKYVNEENKEVETRIENNVTDVSIPDLAIGSSFDIVTVFFPAAGVDTIYKKITYDAPLVAYATGQKVLSLSNVAGSMFFTRGESLIQKDPAHKLLVYTLDTNNQLAHTSTMEGVWNMYGFMYSSSTDMLIVVDRQRSNYVSTYRFEGNTLPLLVSQIGRGYNFAGFMSFDGLFYTIAVNGEVKRWMVQADGNWGNPKGGDLMATGFNQYSIYLTHQNKFVLAVDAEGSLWCYNVALDGKIDANRSKIGRGWNKYTAMYSFGDKLIGQDANGDFWLHDFNIDTYWILK